MTPDPKATLTQLAEVHNGSSPENSSPATNGASDSATRARGLAGLVQDFVKRARGQQPPPAAEQAPELLDLLLEGPDALVVVLRERGQIVEISRRFCEWTGRTREQLLDRPLLALFPDTEHKIVHTLYEDAGAGGVHVVEIPSGNNAPSRLIEFTSRQSDSGNGEFALLVGRDVGERAISERYLRTERDRLNTFIRAMRDGLALLDISGDVRYANPTMETFFESYELPIVCHRWLKEFARDDHSDLQGLTSAYGGRTLKLDAGDGRMFLVTRSFLFEAGKPAQLMLMAKDITEQSLIEKQNHLLELELTRESKLAEFGMLVAGIAHNLNGPLTGILGLCDLMKMKGTATSEIEQMRKQATVMRDLIANLLTKSRNERELEPRELDVREILDTELRFLEGNLFFKHQIQKKLLITDDLPTIFGVYIDLSQVIGNLLRNAIDAMYESSQKQLTVKAFVQDRHLVLQVTDTGSGMTPEVQARIFEPFFTTKPKQTEAINGGPVGTGLGLSSSRTILARYGALLDVQSAPGDGSTFTVKLPIGRKPELLPRS
ncbi:MAG: PAS domain-containing sensor histidine kinase [bacterium]|nr:PAS domain-containing sensor histidine kinase [bacterium]